MSVSWAGIDEVLRQFISEDAAKSPKAQVLDKGQRASLAWIATRAQQSGIVLADEVGTGKTRIACAVVHAVLKAGGRAAVVVPKGLMHQWQKEAKILGMPCAKEFSSLGEFIHAEDSGSSAPNPKVAEWILFSHGFRSPQVRQGRYPAEWRIALPSYVRAELSSAARKADERTKAGRLLGDPDEKIHEIAQSICNCLSGAERVSLRVELDKLPMFKPAVGNKPADNRQLIEALQADAGRRVVERLLGRWFGEFNLVVVDEAHKGRATAEVEEREVVRSSGSVLSRLVEELLRQPNEGRRICLTATPMELELKQWGDLLRRARCSLNVEDVLENVIKPFQEAAEQAAIAPDEGRRLDILCSTATNFTKALVECVTRRRRDDDPRVVAFGDNGLVRGIREQQPQLFPRPHRRVQALQVPWTDSAGSKSPWLDVLFAAECMNKSLLGLPEEALKDALVTSKRDLSDVEQRRLKHLIREVYVRLAAGHLSSDAFDADIKIVPPEGASGDIEGKLRRAEYWRSRMQAAMAGGAHEDEHPRILAAVKEIEGWTLRKEKVLVFGVFLRPLRLLRDVLNVRHALRAADALRPISHALHSDRDLIARQAARLRAEGAFTGCLAGGDASKVFGALKHGHREYENLRKRIRNRAKGHVKSWRREKSLWVGLPVDGELEEALHDHLMSFILEDFLSNSPESDEPTRERVDELSADFLETRLRPLVSELGDEPTSGDSQATQRQNAVRGALVEDYDGQQSLHSRLLQGETRWETRRNLQAAFNKPDASPRVLIAQSQVGREGLNLHEACRVVVQFHAEWNPAVLEQQVGRVDRKGSYWEKLADAWLSGKAPGQPKFIEVRQLVFEGTYDAYQWDRVARRQQVFDASLFGSLLPLESLQSVPPHRVQDLLRAAPSFSPPDGKS